MGAAAPARKAGHEPVARDPARFCVVSAAIFGCTGIAAAAFGAHALKSRLDENALELFETAARYQLLHAVALLACAWIVREWPGTAARLAPRFFAAGIVLFSGSLYALAFAAPRLVGAITPIGGLLFLVAWICLGLAALRTR
jgi:uncharacterized membrane protein YgdD (TMEM256/DUF423 family)